MADHVVSTARVDLATFLAMARRVEREAHRAVTQAHDAEPSSNEVILGAIRCTTTEMLKESPMRSNPFAHGALINYVTHSMLGAGPLNDPLNDPKVQEIMVNSPRKLFVLTDDGSIHSLGSAFYDDDHVRRILERLIDSARGASRTLEPAEGIQDFSLADGSRMHVVHPELTSDGHFVINIRRFGPTKSNVPFGIPPIALGAVRLGATLLICGLPGSGKTTLLRNLVNRLDPHERIVLAEEVSETRLDLPNVAHLQTRRARNTTKEIDLRALVGAFLRMSPDRALVGEIRDREALAFLLTVSSGVPGLSTIHARSTRDALIRLRLLSELALGSAHSAALTQLISEGIDLVCFLERDKDRFEVAELVAVEDPALTQNGATFVTTPLPIFGHCHTSIASTRLGKRFPALVSNADEATG
jgi:pilus assembly protein CpaF